MIIWQPLKLLCIIVYLTSFLVIMDYSLSSWLKWDMLKTFKRMFTVFARLLITYYESSFLLQWKHIKDHIFNTDVNVKYTASIACIWQENMEHKENRSMELGAIALQDQLKLILSNWIHY